MTHTTVPEIGDPESVQANEVLLVASGDLRQSANQVCWEAQAWLEEMLSRDRKSVV